jgi:hypothetical protein
VTSESSLVTLPALTAFLHADGWVRVAGKTASTQVFEPPRALEAPDDYRLVLPSDENASDAHQVVQRVWTTISSLYGTSSYELLSRVNESIEILSVRLRGRVYEQGTPPLSHFYSILDRIRGVLLKTAGFVYTSDHSVVTLPRAAQAYLAACRYLATTRGSFVTKIAIPRQGFFEDAPDFFEQRADASEVAGSVEGLTGLLLNRVVRGDQAVFTEGGIMDARANIGLPALQEFRRLLTAPDATEVDVDFSSAKGTRHFESGALDKTTQSRLKAFEAAARKTLSGDRDLDVTGIVTEIRSRAIDRRNNWIGITATVDGHLERITLKVGRDDFAYFLTFLKPDVRIHLRASATRMRTQLRVRTLVELTPVV